MITQVENLERLSRILKIGHSKNVQNGFAQNRMDLQKTRFQYNIFFNLLKETKESFSYGAVRNLSGRLLANMLL